MSIITASTQNLAKQIDIDELPYVLMVNKDKLPDGPGVYFIESRNVILYIGMSETSLLNRHKQHHRSHQIESQFVDPKIIYYSCSEDVARDLETALIKQYNPLLQNTKIVPHTRVDLGTEVLPQVENGEVHIKIETVLENISLLSDSIKGLDRNILMMSQRVERLECITEILISNVKTTVN